MITEIGPVELDVPRDRDGTFEPRLIAKHDRRFTGFDDKVLALYARGMTVREIQGFLAEQYGTEVSPEFISSVTDAVMETVGEATWDHSLKSLRPGGTIVVSGLLVLALIVLATAQLGSNRLAGICSASGCEASSCRHCSGGHVRINASKPAWLAPSS